MQPQIRPQLTSGMLRVIWISNGSVAGRRSLTVEGGLWDTELMTEDCDALLGMH